MDYYGRRLATCSSDATVRIFDVSGESQQLLQELKGHDGPVWQVAWAHPKFGGYIASCSYDHRVLIWREVNKGQWQLEHEHRLHEASVNSLAWAPHEYGLVLACASSDNYISIVCKTNESWEGQRFFGHLVGCTAVSWAPPMPSQQAATNAPGVEGAAAAGGGGAADSQGAQYHRLLASGGCDNAVHIWRWREDGSWQKVEELSEHKDWVRDVAFCPSLGLPTLTLASCSQDGTVRIWTSVSGGSWSSSTLPSFNFPVWRLSWSVTGSILAVACGDGGVYLWKAVAGGQWEQVSKLSEESSQ